MSGKKKLIVTTKEGYKYIITRNEVKYSNGLPKYIVQDGNIEKFNIYCKTTDGGSGLVTGDYGPAHGGADCSEIQASMGGNYAILYTKEPLDLTEVKNIKVKVKLGTNGPLGTFAYGLQRNLSSGDKEFDENLSIDEITTADTTITTNEKELNLDTSNLSGNYHLKLYIEHDNNWGSHSVSMCIYSIVLE